jgi:PAS domain S-box-containing protein
MVPSQDRPPNGDGADQAPPDVSATNTEARPGQTQSSVGVADSEDRHFRLMAKYANDAMYYHGIASDGLPGRFLEVNDAACRCLGYSREECLRLAPTDVDAPEADVDYPKIMDQLRRVGQATFESLHVDRGGARIPVEINAHFFESEGEERVLSVARDVSERKASEFALRESEARYRAIVDGFEGLIYVCDQDYRVEFMNSRCIERTGYDGTGGFCYEILHSLDAPCPWCVNERVFQGETVRWEVKSPKDDRWYYVVNTPILHADGSCSKQALILDITDQKEAAEAKEALSRRSQEAQKLESLGVLAGGIAHDFNNILMAILGNAELALTQVSTGRARECLARIEEASQGAAELCRQLLAYAGKGKVSPELVDLSVVVREMSSMLHLSVAPQQLVCNLVDDLPPAEADVAQLRQVIMNLIINGAEAMEDCPGSVVVTTGRCDVLPAVTSHFAVEPDPDQSYVYVSVSDSGVGMDDEAKQRLFEPFFSTKFPGRGLGLAAVLGIARAHRGAIDVRSEPEQGSEVRVFFPVANVARPPSSGDELDLEQWRGQGTILVVDDEETVRVVAAEMLEVLGFSVVTAATGHEALELVRRHEGLACVVLDLLMPHMSGQECLRRLRAVDARLPVVVSSGYDEQEVPAEIRSLGPTGFIQKPFRINALADVLRQMLER